MINRFQEIAYCALHTSIYLELNPRVLCHQHGLSNTQAVQAIEHYQKGTTPQDKCLVPAIQSLVDNETQFLASFSYPFIITAIKSHQPVPYVEWINIKENLFRARSNFSDFLQEKTGYQSKFLINFVSRDKDRSLASKLQTDPTIIESMSVTIKEGKIHHNGKPLSTTGYTFKSSQDEAGFVVSPSGELYLFNHLGEQPCPITGKVILHSIFTNGPALFAGSMKVAHGSITYISDCSGHYNPAFNIPFINWLYEKRLLTPSIQWYDFSNTGDISSSDSLQWYDFSNTGAISSSYSLRFSSNIGIAFNTLALSVLDNPGIMRKIKYLRGYKAHLLRLLSALPGKARSSVITSRLSAPLTTSGKFHEYYTFAKLMDDILPDSTLATRHVDFLKSRFFEHLNLWLSRLNLPVKDIIGSKSIIYCQSIPGISEDVSIALLGLVKQPNMDIDEAFGLRSFAENTLELKVPPRRQLMEARASIFSS